MADAPKARAGRLSVVATPIGNLDDITLRALETLRSCDRILAEDTRRTGTLLKHFEIRKPLSALHAHNEAAHAQRWLDALATGTHLALVSDAGTPLVSDPGAVLVRAAVEAGAHVEAIPGVSAALTALTLSGLPSHRFRFVGFLPRGSKLKRELKRLASAEDTLVVFEAPTRVHAFLEAWCTVADGERRIAVCRELTKLHETVYRDTAITLRDTLPHPLKGECTLVIAPAPNEDAPAAITLETLQAAMLDAELSNRDQTRLLRRLRAHLR